MVCALSQELIVCLTDLGWLTIYINQSCKQNWKRLGSYYAVSLSVSQWAPLSRKLNSSLPSPQWDVNRVHLEWWSCHRALQEDQQKSKTMDLVRERVSVCSLCLCLRALGACTRCCLQRSPFAYKYWLIYFCAEGNHYCCETCKDVHCLTARPRKCHTLWFVLMIYTL